MDSRKYDIKKYWWMILLVLALVNGFYYFGIDHFSQQPVATHEEMRKSNQYFSLVSSTGEQTVWTTAAYVKL